MQDDTEFPPLLYHKERVLQSFDTQFIQGMILLSKATHFPTTLMFSFPFQTSHSEKGGRRKKKKKKENCFY